MAQKSRITDYVDVFGGWSTKFHFIANYAVFCTAYGARAMLETLQTSANMSGLSNARSAMRVGALEVILEPFLHQLPPDASTEP